jgi:mannosyl-3-phosphoglycerate synthase
VLWYLPGDSPVIVVTNCPEENLASIKSAIQDSLVGHKKIFMVHQKDERVAHLFGTHGVEHILGYDGKVLDGKGEGMYIGTLFAALLGYPQWIVFYDADNIVPCALLEYTLAMGRLFLAVHPAYENRMPAFLHNVRICWSSKPSLTSGKLEENVLGRCTRVISPLFHDILENWLGVRNYLVSSSNAGEQGMTMTTAKALRFSSGFSVETFQLLDFFSLGSFFIFRHCIPQSVEDQIYRLIDDLHLHVTSPLIYPSLDSLDLSGDEELVNHYRLFDEVETGEYKIAAAFSTSWSDAQ